MNDTERIADANNIAAAEAGGESAADRFEELARIVKAQPKKSHFDSSVEKDISFRLTELLRSEEHLTEAVSLIEDIPIEVVASVVSNIWPDLSPESKDRFLNKLLSLNSGKAILRQIAIARRLAERDGENASVILHRVITKSAKGDDFPPSVSEDKRTSIRKWFFSDNQSWVGPQSENEEIMKPILGVFVQIADDPGLLKKIVNLFFLYKFVCWAASNLSRIRIDRFQKEETLNRILNLKFSWRPEWKEEVKRLAGAYSAEIALKSPLEEPYGTDDTPGLSEANEEERRDSTEKLIELPSEKIAEEIDRGSQSEEPSTSAIQSAPATLQVDDLLTRTNALIVQKKAEIARIESEADLLRTLCSSLADLKTLKERVLELTGELSAAEKRLTGVQAAASKLESSLELSERARLEAEDRIAKLQAKFRETSDDLDRERAEREEDRKRFVERIDRAIAVRVDEFKEKVKLKLQPIINEKKETDDKEPSIVLAEFLRLYFSDVEKKLKELGIKI